jgi:hypothetical protein
LMPSTWSSAYACGIFGSIHYALYKMTHKTFRLNAV